VPPGAAVPMLAENVIALLVLPDRYAADSGPALAPSYGYDSRNTANAVTLNQLPPRLVVALVAIDEASAERLAAQNGDANVGGRLAQGRALVAERFGAEAEPLAPGSLGDLVVRRNGAVWRVVVGGRVVVDNGVLATADYESIAADARAQATRLWSRMATI